MDLPTLTFQENVLQDFGIKESVKVEHVAFSEDSVPYLVLIRWMTGQKEEGVSE